MSSGLRGLALGLAATLFVGCGETTEAQRESSTAAAQTSDAWVTDWPTFARQIESQSSVSEFDGFVKKYRGKQVRWAGVVEWATCERGRCSMTITMKPDTLRLPGDSTPGLVQLLLDVSDPGRKLEPGAAISFRTTLRSEPEPLFGRRGIRLMIYNDGSELVADGTK
jgi:hypothetical protein